MVVEPLHLRLQPCAGAELPHELVHDARLVGGEGIRVPRGLGGAPHARQRGEVTRAQRVGLLADLHRASRKVDLVQQQASLHVPLGMSADGLSLALEQKDGDGLHDGRKRGTLSLVRIRGGGEGAQGRKRDAVALLELRHVAVLQVVAQHRGNARRVARGGAHPAHVVVAPLHVALGQGHEHVHDLVAARAAVPHVAEHVHGTACEGAHARRQGAQGLLRRACLAQDVHQSSGGSEIVGKGYEGVQAHVTLALRRAARTCEDARTRRPQELAGVDELRKLAQAATPPVRVRLASLAGSLRNGLRIAHQGAQAHDFRIIRARVVSLLQESPQLARARQRQVPERFGLAVDVAHEMHGPARQGPLGRPNGLIPHLPARLRVARHACPPVTWLRQANHTTGAWRARGERLDVR